MSVRAYRVIEIKAESTPAFNLHNDGVVEVFGIEISSQLNEDGCGLISISTDRIEEELGRTTDNESLLEILK